MGIPFWYTYMGILLLYPAVYASLLYPAVCASLENMGGLCPVMSHSLGDLGRFMPSYEPFFGRLMPVLHSLGEIYAVSAQFG